MRVILTIGLASLISLASLVVAPSPALAAGHCAFTISGTTMTLQADCVTTTTIHVPHGFTLYGNGKTITAKDPAGGHFKGGIVRNAGTVAHVRDLTVRAQGLAVACHSGNDRLRGILFDGAGGSITNNVVRDINQGASGCQEGNAIEVRKAPFDGTGTNPAVVTISGNQALNYQKNGITANGDVVATILNNVVVGAGPVGYIAQNGIQVGFGASGTVRGNEIRGNSYTGSGWSATGLLLYDIEPSKVRRSQNRFADNQNDVAVIPSASLQP